MAMGYILISKIESSAEVGSNNYLREDNTMEIENLKRIAKELMDEGYDAPNSFKQAYGVMTNLARIVGVKPEDLAAGLLDHEANSKYADAVGKAGLAELEKQGKSGEETIKDMLKELRELKEEIKNKK